MDFSKKNLAFDKEYKWQAPKPKGDNLKLIGTPDNDLLNREEGYEVLYFVQQFMKKRKTKSIDSGKKVEILIRKYLPGHIRGRKDVEQWLIDNWDRNHDELELIKKGYEPFNEFLHKNTLKKLDYVVNIRGTSRREVVSELIEVEFDNMIDNKDIS